MSKVHPISLGSVVFPTKAACKSHFQEILHGAPLNTQLATEIEGQLRLLLQRHPGFRDKTGEGVRSFEVRLNSPPGCKTTRGFWLTRNDGTETDFSYIVCIKGSPLAFSTRLKEALRRAVRDDLNEVKERYFDLHGEEAPCMLGGSVRYGWEELEVDHHVPMTFAMIVDAFMTHRELSGMLLGASDLTSNHDGDLLESLNDSVAKQFRVFHRSMINRHGSLRVISKTKHRRLKTQSNRDGGLEIRAA